MTQVLDYSAGFPGSRAVKAAGAIGAVRYAGTPGRRKNLTAAEFADFDRAGLAVATVYENRAGDYLGGYAAGQRAARAWLADVSGIDERLTRVGHFAVDRDVVSEWATLRDYFRGINSVIGVARTRGYGEADVVDYLVAHALASGGQWQTVAWSRGERSQHAALLQLAQQITVGGVRADVNTVLMDDWGQHNHEEDDMTPGELFKAKMPKDGSWVPPGSGTFGHVITGIHQAVFRNLGNGAKLAALTAAVAKLAADPNIDEARLAELLDAAVAEHTPTAQENAAELLPYLQAALVDVLGEDNTEQADAIIDALTERLQGATV